MRCSYKSITFDIIRKIGLLDSKDFFKGWLNYSRYGTPTRKSKVAIAQGGRDEEAMHFHFYKHNNVAVMKYKIFEADTIPYLPIIDAIPVSDIKVAGLLPQFSPDSNNVQVFREHVHDILPYLIAEDTTIVMHPAWAKLKEWPERHAVQEGVVNLSRLTEEHRQEWTRWFMDQPKVTTFTTSYMQYWLHQHTFSLCQTVDDLKAQEKFKWTLPDIVRLKDEAMREAAAIRRRAETEDSTQSYQHLGKYTCEVIVHPLHTVSDLKREHNIRAENFARSEKAKADKEHANNILDALKAGAFDDLKECDNFEEPEAIPRERSRKRKAQDTLDDKRDTDAQEKAQEETPPIHSANEDEVRCVWQPVSAIIIVTVVVLDLRKCQNISGLNECPRKHKSRRTAKS